VKIPNNIDTLNFFRPLQMRLVFPEKGTFLLQMYFVILIMSKFN